MKHLLLCLPLAACAVSEDSFGTSVARAYCPQLKSCDLDLFWDTFYDGTPDCLVEVADDVNDQRYGGGTAACSWQQADAESCLDMLADASCDEVLSPTWFSSCVAAWDCVAIVDPGAPR